VSKFAEIRKRHIELIERITTQLENKDDDFNNYDAQILEKMIKGGILLETADSKSGSESEYKNTELDDLTKDFE
jgi:hypothetical protein